MKYQTKILKQLLVAVSLSITAFSAHAVTFTVGNILPLPGTTVAAEPQLAGSVLVDELIPFSFASDAGLISGTVQQRVVRSSVDNTIDFYWRVLNDAESAAIGSFRVGNFVSPEINANYRTDGLGVLGPDSGHLFANGTDFNFLFSHGLAGGQGSNFFFFDTTATNYAKTALFDLTGTGAVGISGPFAAYAPAAAVPEPETYAMMLAGLGLMGFIQRKKQS
jgi:PEP-CTERM motif